MFLFQEISFHQTLDLRSRILRPGQSVELCRYAEDEFTTTFHLGIYLDGKVVCSGTFIKQADERFLTARLPYRLRGIASDNGFQNRGLGSALITSAIDRLITKKCDLLWFNARTTAENFYQKLGFDQINKVFEIPTIGPHKVMYKWL